MPILHYTDLYRVDNGARVQSKRAFHPLVELETQIIRLPIFGLCGIGDNGGRAIALVIDDQLKRATKLPYSLFGLNNQQPVVIFAWQRIAFNPEPVDGDASRTTRESAR